jgi:superfamily II DNA or RNA helicase
MSEYAAFLARKAQLGGLHGFAPTFTPSWLYDFQAELLDWATRKGRAAVFADCGLGKTPLQLAWAQNVVEHTNGRVLVLTPLAVAAQTVREGAKFGIACERSQDGHTHAAITVTNYERLHYFSPTDFTGVVCDESSILKHFSGATQKEVTRFLLKVPHRLLCTATAAPNDYIELGTSSEALGELGYSEMLTRFFRQDDKKPHRLEDIKHWRASRDPSHFAKLAFRVSQQIGQWRLKGHAVTPFWRWIASWARACRKPSDLGFEDASFILPPLTQRDHVVMPKTPGHGLLFVRPAVGLSEERDERRRTLEERCRLVAALVDDGQPAVVWCHLNVEGDALARAIPGSVQVKGADTDAAKEAAYLAFAAGDIRVLITKPVIGAWGLNWQHCAHVVTFASHSYEQLYQSVRRCWRFGQTRPVTVDVISTEGEVHVRDSMIRKAAAADVMFAELVRHMHDVTHIERTPAHGVFVKVPIWVS